MTDQDIRKHVTSVIMRRFSQEEERRQEAAYEYLAASLPGLGHEETMRMAEMIPPVLPDLYSQWVAMFCDTLLDTIPRNQLDHLCNGSDDNNAALVLVFIMFMESARMEEQVEQDLKDYGIKHSWDDDMGGAVANLIRARMDQWKGPQKK